MSQSKPWPDERRSGERLGFQHRKGYTILHGDSVWWMYTLRDGGFMDDWNSLISHACPKDGEVYSGHWAPGYPECSNCHTDLPDDLITLWKLHNADNMWRIEL